MRINECRELALQYAGKAETALNDECREDYLRAAKSWMNLAQSYEFASQLLSYRDAGSYGTATDFRVGINNLRRDFTDEGGLPAS